MSSPSSDPSTPGTTISESSAPSQRFNVEKSGQTSTPQTPKGHPLSDGSMYGTYVAFGGTKPLSEPASKLAFPSNYPRADLHSSSRHSYRTTISYLLRIPRKLRPVLLLGVVLLTVCAIMLRHATGRSTELDRFRQQRLAMLQGQTFVENSAKQEEGQLAMAALPYDDVHPGIITQLTPDEELAALLAFITSTTANALPELNPTVPLEPSLILDFDYTKSTSRSDLRILMDDVTSRYPVVLIGRMRDPWHREIKKLLSLYKIKPSPLIIDVDQRLDQEVMIPLLARLLDTPTLPQLVLSLAPVGSYPEVMQLRDSGEFTTAIASSGAYITAITHNAKGAKERLRHENERLLAPGPMHV